MDIFLWPNATGSPEDIGSERTKRFEQSFRSKTFNIMSTLKVGVVGISGSSSPVAEMPYRLGVGELMLVDDDRIETKNIGRIYNPAMQDAVDRRYIVEVTAASFAAHGLPTKVRTMVSTTRDPSVVRELAQCDVASSLKPCLPHCPLGLETIHAGKSTFTWHAERSDAWQNSS
ncbi:MAG: ThiF family adenylyltransferase [Spirochaetota bacterium]